MLIYRGGMPDTVMNTHVKYSSLFAAMVHDYQHGGLNNDFLIKTHHPFALLYNDQSPLENHHCAATCKLIYDEEFRYLPVGLVKLAGHEALSLVCCGNPTVSPCQKQSTS